MTMGDVNVDIEYLSAGANRQTAAADWNVDGTVAFGSDTNIALWRPNDPTPRGIYALLGGHRELVKAVKFLPSQEGDEVAHLLSGGDDQCIKLWKLDTRTGNASCVQTVHDHAAPINCIAALRAGQTKIDHAQGTTLFATGAADASIKVWSFDGAEIKVLQTIKTSPKYFPLALALSPLGADDDTYILAAAGTRHTIQIYVGALTDSTTDFSLQATLAGHEGWIRSLDFTREQPSAPAESDLLLASASQDKYIRLWRVHQGAELPAQAAVASDPTIGAYLPGRSPSNKAHRFPSPRSGGGEGEEDYSVTFESLLFNHDDWIYSARWHARTAGADADATLQLLSTSADNSLAVWECDPASGIWVTSARLGEISREKGATTATGSIGGFWTGLWSPTGASLLTLGRTGAWRRWDWDAPSQAWAQQVSVSGHVRPVTGIAWSRAAAPSSSSGGQGAEDGPPPPPRPRRQYLLSTSADQTTRLHAPWAATGTWHEMARPQIHGYDLNCIDALGPARFVSGADEKLMRVFGAPRAVARVLRSVAGIGISGGGGGGGDDQGDNDDDDAAMPDAADMPVLGLSNKATSGGGPSEGAEAPPEAEDGVGLDAETAAGLTPQEQTGRTAAPDETRPPLEEALSRHTLWPEEEKLYGHGYEISCLAASHSGRLVASACRASSLNHAVVRLFETTRWTELRPPLAAHALTATRLRFSGDDALLLSVGRDRQWAVFGRRGEGAEKGEGQGEEEMGYELRQAEPKGHTRMILDAAWAPVGEGLTRVFATAGRDKNVKIWAMKAEAEGGQFGLAATVADEQPVTAVDFLFERTKEGHLVLASGNDAGRIRIHTLCVNGSDVSVVSTLTVKPELCLSKAVLQLAWRPSSSEENDGYDLAIAGDDSSLRIYKIKDL